MRSLREKENFHFHLLSLLHLNSELEIRRENICNSSKLLTGADNFRADITFKSGSWIGLGVWLVRFAIGINWEECHFKF